MRESNMELSLQPLQQAVAQTEKGVCCAEKKQAGEPAKMVMGFVENPDTAKRHNESESEVEEPVS